jgi:hypothetical protein
VWRRADGWLWRLPVRWAVADRADGVGDAGEGYFSDVGALVGLSPVASVVAVATCGFAAGILPVLDGGGQWIDQQCAIALLIAAGFPDPLGHALVRGGLVAVGGNIQMLTIEALPRLGDANVELAGWPATGAVPLMRGTRSGPRSTVSRSQCVLPHGSQPFSLRP